MYEKKEKLILPTESNEEILISTPFKVTLVMTAIITGSFIFTLWWLITNFYKIDIMNPQMYPVFFRRCLFSLSMSVCFVGIVATLKKRRPFSNYLTICVKCIGILHVAGSFLYAQIPGIEEPWFVVFRFAERFYFHGEIFMTGVLMILLSTLLHYGLAYQNQSDTTI